MKKLIIDTDCGVDDAIAILMALQCKDVKVIGITTVSGNTSIENATKNVLRILNYLDRNDIPVYRGASAPLYQKIVRADVHGKDGLGDISIPLGLKREEIISAPEGVRKLLSDEEKVDIVAIGPLTNIALTFNLFPEIIKKINSITIMGGAIEKGNVTRFAEFNFFADPEAVQFLLNLKIPLTIVPWDPIVKIQYLQNEVEYLSKDKGKLGKLFYELAQTPMKYIKKHYGIKMLSLPDPIAMAVYLYPDVIKGEVIGNFKMELNEITTRGMSVLIEGDNLRIITDIDKVKFTNYLSNSL